ncbi:MAG: hypothetical protein H8E03_00720 [Pelagibacteraceae bacterium]|nr:hypothetical protein [Pelagibacteraceae bacterium]
MARLKPVPRNQRYIYTTPVPNRGEDRRRDKQEQKNVEVTLMDHDAAIMYYFKEVIHPTVMEQGEEIDVPIMYANPERWKTIQKNGHLRDSKKQLITPLIAFKRTSVAKDDTFTVDKLDANDPKLFYTFEKKYTQSNRYDKFSVQQGILPQRELYNVAVPDYVLMTYECIIWTSYIEQMNSIIESINYSDGSYWGEPGKFKFKVNIDSFDDASEMEDSERMIKTNFSFNFRGYLIPESFNNYITTKKYLTPARVNINDETDISFSRIFAPDSRAETVTLTGGKFSSGLPNGLGSATDFIRGARSAVGQETQDLEFTNTYGGETKYIMRFSGEPTSSGDNLTVMTYGFVSESMTEKHSYFSGSQSSSIDTDATPYRQVYQVSVPSDRQLFDGSVFVSVNGTSLSSDPTQTDITSENDFFISSSTDGLVAINQSNSDGSGGNIGIIIDENDQIIIKYVLATGV